ncbi:hypothetical protein F0L74_20455 [Chitinophaga agrisoli]|uniref:Uncharacterized protein n=1 Tax=Chitinophaga agrisoli TaxID=2607653 RepID=A0A5B2VIV8_9BACT|nr:hypothetical protein [Chitinophaga agrisoli]KAA2238598.1 hypothetical protein F0L74_20455 [Chitinophaga agrisoli]
MKSVFIILSFVFLVCLGCKHSKKTKSADPFYSKGNLFDRLNIPLIKPYKLIKVNDTEWRLELQTTSLLTLSIDNVQGVDTVARKIMIYFKGGTEVNNIQYNELWFIIDPASLSERSFNSYDGFNNALKKINIDKVNFRKPDMLLQ